MRRKPLTLAQIRDLTRARIAERKESVSRMENDQNPILENGPASGIPLAASITTAITSPEM